MYDEYEKLVEELQTVRVDVDLSISELIKEELRGYPPPCPEPLNPYRFGNRYQPVKKDKEKIRLGVD